MAKKVLARLGAAGLVDGGDGRMLEARQRLGLAFKQLTMWVST
jgi:hypothetical protein